MRSTPETEKAHHDQLAAILLPLGYQVVRIGVFSQKNHQWLHFDLTAADPKPETVIQVINDNIWDFAKAEGIRHNQAELQKAMGLK